jgi:hypothetical protein
MISLVAFKGSETKRRSFYFSPHLMSHQSPVFCTLFQNQKKLGHFGIDRSASLHELTSLIRRSFDLSSKGILLRTDQGEEISSDNHLAFLLRHSTGAVRFFMSQSRLFSETRPVVRLARHSLPVSSPRHRSETCGHCHEEIEGARFQCLHCPVQLNLCSGCEAFQCRVQFHPKKHVFAKFCNSSQTLPDRFMPSTESSRPSYSALRAGNLGALEQARQERDSLSQERDSLRQERDSLRRVPRESEPFEPVFAKSSWDRPLSSYGAPWRETVSHKPQEHHRRNPGEARNPLRPGRDFPHSSSSPFDSDTRPLFDGYSARCRVPLPRNQRDSPSN